MRSTTDLPHVSCRRTVESSHQEFVVSKEDGAGNVLFCRKVRDWRLWGMCAEIFDLRETNCDFKFTSIQLTRSSPISIEWFFAPKLASPSFGSPEPCQTSVITTVLSSWPFCSMSHIYPTPAAPYSMHRFLHLTLALSTRQQSISFPTWRPSPSSNCR